MSKLNDSQKSVRAFVGIAVLLLAGLTFAFLTKSNKNAKDRNRFSISGASGGPVEWSGPFEVRRSAPRIEDGDNGTTGLGGGGGFTVGEGEKESFDIEFARVDGKETTFRLNGKTYEIKKGTAVIFYGELNNNKARSIELEFEDGTKITSLIEKGKFFLQSKDPEADFHFTCVRLFDKDKNKILDQELDNHIDERMGASPDSEETPVTPSVDIDIELGDDGMGMPDFIYRHQTDFKFNEQGMDIGAMEMRNIHMFNYLTPLNSKFRKGKDFKIAFSKEIYVLEGNTGTVFYGTVKKPSARYISIVLSNGSTITGEIKNKQFLVGTPTKFEDSNHDPFGMLKSVSLLDKNKKIFEKEPRQFFEAPFVN